MTLDQEITAFKRPHPSAVDQHELTMGIQEEFEHTDDPRIAQRIALDHLGEDPKYYSKLKKCFHNLQSNPYDEADRPFLEEIVAFKQEADDEGYEPDYYLSNFLESLGIGVFAEDYPFMADALRGIPAPPSAWWPILVAKAQGMVYDEEPKQNPLYGPEIALTVRDWQRQVEKVLSPRQARVYLLRRTGSTLREIAADFGVTYERIRQIEDRAKQKLEWAGIEPPPTVDPPRLPPHQEHSYYPPEPLPRGSALSPQQEDILYLWEAGMSVKAIGKLLNVTSGQVSGVLMKARKRAGRSRPGTGNWRRR